MTLKVNFSKLIISFLFLLPFIPSSIAQIKFRTVKGIKANYTIEIPPNFQNQVKIGANVDLKYANDQGVSIVTTVVKLPIYEKIEDLGNITTSDLINFFKSKGKENISIISNGFFLLNGAKTHYMYYRDEILYYHSISQYVQGKCINLTFTCKYTDKTNYMPMLYRVVNSFNHI